MGIWGRISRRFMGREGEAIGSGEGESHYGADPKISGGEEEKRPEPEEKPVPTPKAQAPGSWQVGDVIRPDDGGYSYEVRGIKVGGMGQVYICICIWGENRTPFVLKSFQEKFLREKLAIERFRWEAEVWVRLGRHKNIVRAHRTETALGYTFVLLEYVPGDENYGPDLSGWIRKGGLSIDLVLDFAVQFCTGMLHAREVFARDPTLKPPFVHRDIKPANIMVTRDRVVKVTDFGLVKAFAFLEGEIDAEAEDEWGQPRHSFTKKGGVCGTPPYIAPEIWRGEEPNERADIYSFGCTLYEMLSGFPPFVYDRYDPERHEKYRYAHLDIIPRPIPGIPSEINALVLRCLEKDPDKRHQGFKSLREALAEIHFQRTGKRLTWREETEAKWQADDWRDKGVGLMDLGFHQEAIECYTQSLRLNPNYDLAHNDRGITYSNLGQYERAIEDYDEAIRLSPSYDFTYINRGNAYYNLGQHEQAIADFDEALRLDPRDAIAYCARGFAYYNLGQHERAIADYDAAIGFNPRYALAYNNRGVCYKDLSQHERAIADYDAAIGFNPRYALAYRNRGVCYKDLSQHERAIADFDAAIGIDPKYAAAYNSRGSAYDNLGQYERAIADYDAAIGIDPKYAFAYNNRGNAYDHLGQHERAIADFDAAIGIDPKYAAAYYNRAEAYEKLGRPERALEDYKRFVELAPPLYAQYVEQAKQKIEVRN